MPTTLRNTDILFNDGTTQSTSATSAGPRARITFDGRYGGSYNSYYGVFTAGAITTIYSSSNVSSVTKNNFGDYTVNFTTALPDADYCMTGSCNARVNHPYRGVSQYVGSTPTTSSIRVSTGATGGASLNGFFEDCERINIAFFR